MDNYFYRKLVFAKAKSGGTSNYADLANKPQINGTTLTGNKTLDELGITAGNLNVYTKEETIGAINDVAYDIVQNSPGAALDDVVPKQTATDSIININDALKYKTFNFKVDGAYEQNGEPTPEAPIPITPLSFDKITKIGQNLLPNTFYSKNAACSIDDDGWASLTFNNSGGTSEQYFNLYYDSAKLKPNKNYNVILEVKELSGTGTVVVCSNATFSEQKEGQFSTDYRLTFSSLQSGKIYNKICLTKTDLDNIVTSTRSFVQADPGQVGSITFRISILEDTSVTPDNFIYQPYKEDNYSIDLQGNEMVSLPNGIKDELQIDKEGNVNLIKKVGKVVFNGTEQGWWLSEANQFRIKLPGLKQWGSLLSDKFIDKNSTEIGTMLAYYPEFIWFVAKETTLEDWQNYIENNPITVYYELAELQTISLGKLSDIITTEQGSNTFAINSNIDTQISTTYALDLKKYIDNKIAQVSQAIVEGE